MDEEVPGWGIGRWILPALLLSLVLHAIFWWWARGFPVERMSDAFYERIVPRTFHLERAEIDPKLLEPSPAEEARPARAPTAIALPDESSALDKMAGESRATPTAPRLDTAAALAVAPEIATPSFESTLQAAEAAGISTVLPDEKALIEELFKTSPAVAGTAALELPNPAGLVTSDKPSGSSATAGFSDLDQLLAQTGPLTPETAPILMPTDLLFDYNSSDLRPGAVASLEKLGRLIRRNPNSRFRIEGHTDSFGSDEFNNELSLRRAMAVKEFLTTQMGLPADGIETFGFGKSRLIAPAGGSIDAQQINRRVEIVIREGSNP